MNGMKKLLGVIGILALAAALLPAQGYADVRGPFARVTNGNNLSTGNEQPALRHIDADGIMSTITDGNKLIELWLTFSSRSPAQGFEGTRSIFMILNFDSSLPNFQQSAMAKMLDDPANHTSYFDPNWSSDGRFLAYTQTDANGGNQAIYVQEFKVNDGNDFDYGAGNGAETKIGSPILVTTAGQPRHPHWSPSGYTLAFDSNVAGSYDVYTTDVDVVAGTATTPVRRTFNEVKAETDPTWAPNGHEIAYSTNQFGPRTIQIIDIALAPSDPGYNRLAERNFASISHNNPSYSADGSDLFYDAPAAEDPVSPTNVWKINLATQGKCEIQVDNRADSDPDVSNVLNHTSVADGFVPYSYFMFVTQATGAGVNIWRGNPLNSCLLPLAMGVALVPPVIDINDQTTETFQTVLNYPPETRAAGYVCRFSNTGGDGMRMRNTGFVSPTLMGTIVPPDDPGGVPGTPNYPDGGSPFSYCIQSNTHTAPDSLRITCIWPFRDVADRIVALGLTGDIVPIKVNAYSNRVGRKFQGFGYLRLTNSASPAPVAMLGNSPNPFNPITKIKFAVRKPGNYALRLYNVQGALIRTVASRHFDVGTQEVTWDGRTNTGGMAASGVYYAKMSGVSKTDGSDAIKLVLNK
ncbi:MAG: hypothetical protein E6K79_11145 [Candidatus Eisenbacteria bacterium]|uniref:FlgD/Vpr Ig-like domain-containing protein n=1 Tax=Eiseniibacteriota bacterium TaxID=2212470 RepID=A0A538TH62_UNCEI|nr:MAG: hypothetical protein E6K79_11145 [Candidatus Eisenbacteria bacterium]